MEGDSMTAHRDDPPAREGETTSWEAEWAAHKAVNAAERRKRGPILRCMARGFRLRCPRCGEGKVLRSFLKPNPACACCGEDYSAIRTDDFAPWLGILVIGHVLVPLAILVETLFQPSLTAHLIIWTLVGLEMVLLFLPRAKGMALGLMWSLNLRGDEHQH